MPWDLLGPGRRTLNHRDGRQALGCERLEVGLQAGNARPFARAGGRLDLRPQKTTLAHPVGPCRSRAAGCRAHKAIADCDTEYRRGTWRLVAIGPQLGAEQAQLDTILAGVTRVPLEARPLEPLGQQRFA